MIEPHLDPFREPDPDPDAPVRSSKRVVIAFATLLLALAVAMLAFCLPRDADAQTLTLTHPAVVAQGDTFTVEIDARSTTNARLSTAVVVPNVHRDGRLQIVRESVTGLGMRVVAVREGTGRGAVNWFRADGGLLSRDFQVRITAPAPAPPPPDTVRPAPPPPIDTVAPRPPPPPDTASGPAALPELPQVTPQPPVLSPRRTIRVATADALQAALDSARGGDEVVCQAGQTYTRYGFRLRARAVVDTGWVLLRSSALDRLPAGQRVTPSDSGSMCRLMNTVPGEPALRTDAGADRIYLAGLEVTVPPGTTRAGTLVSLGDGSSAQNELAEMPKYLVLDRSYIHGRAETNLQRCVALHTGWAAVVNNWMDDCHGLGFDSQALVSWNGTGPHLLENNTFIGAGENVMYGGADPAIHGLLPRDITIRRNHFYKPIDPRWMPDAMDIRHGFVLRDSAGVPTRWVRDSTRAWVQSATGVLRSSDPRKWSVKNPLEFKVGVRVLAEENVLEHNWPDAQTGTGFLAKTVNQSGRAIWSETSHLTFRRNYVTGVTGGLALAGAPGSSEAVPMHTVLVEQNIVETEGGRLIQLSEVKDLTIRRNTFVGTAQALVFAAGMNDRFTFTHNLLRSGGYGITGATTTTLPTLAPGFVFTDNVLSTSHGAAKPPGNTYPGSIPWPVTVDALAARFPDAGADLATVRAAIAGVVIPPR